MSLNVDKTKKQEIIKQKRKMNYNNGKNDGNIMEGEVTINMYYLVTEGNCSI